jgi:hypothetical protein
MPRVGLVQIDDPDLDADARVPLLPHELGVDRIDRHIQREGRRRNPKEQYHEHIPAEEVHFSFLDRSSNGIGKAKLYYVNLAEKNRKASMPQHSFIWSGSLVFVQSHRPWWDQIDEPSLVRRVEHALANRISH